MFRREDVKVLLLEDDEINQEIFNGYLEHIGISPALVVETLSEAQAMSEQVLADAFDLLVFDVMLPDGESDVLARKFAGNVNCPMLAFTARSSPADMLRLEEAGFDRVLTKPITLENFKTQIEEFLR